MAEAIPSGGATPAFTVTRSPGRLDLRAASDVADRLAENPPEAFDDFSGHIVVDLRAVRGINSRICGWLIHIVRGKGARRVTVVCNAQGVEVLELLRLNTMMRVTTEPPRA
jgi:hypothetical protein